MTIYLLPVRRLRRRAAYSAINVLGLTLGLTVFLILAVIVRHEMSYDRVHEGGQDVYRIIQSRYLDGSEERLATTPLVLADHLPDNFPEIESVTRLLRESGGLIRIGDASFIERNLFFVDIGFADVFTFTGLAGNLVTALVDPSSIVLSASAAERYFGSTDIVGRTLDLSLWGRVNTLTVGAVLADAPSASHFDFDVLVPWNAPYNLWQSMHGEDWHYSGAWSYVRLAPGTAPAGIDGRLAELVNREYPADLRSGTRLGLQPLRSIHLESDLADEIAANGSRVYVAAFSAIALLVLLIACINYMNLATAQSAIRAREVGVRKALGATRASLIRSDVAEAVVLATTGTVMAVILTATSMPLVRQFMGMDLYLSDLPWSIGILAPAVTAVATGLLSGIYPALVLARFSPIDVLRAGRQGRSGGSPLFRRVLVTSQLVVSTILLIAVGAIFQQTHYLTNLDPGFDTQNVTYVRMRNGVPFRQVRDALERRPGVTDMVATSSVPGSIAAPPTTFSLFRTRSMAQDGRKQMQSMWIGEGFLDFFDLDIEEGRPFHYGGSADSSSSVVINRTAAVELGWVGDALGREIDVFNMMGDFSGTYKVVGVVGDFHYESLHERLEPLVLFSNGDGWYSTIALRMGGSSISGVEHMLNEIWSEHAPGIPLESFSLEQDQQIMYADERHLGWAILFFSAIAILITMIGLIGLAAWTSQRRMKEIGVRKVLGATTGEIVVLLTRESSILVLLAGLVALPAGWVVLRYYLAGFEYSTGISPVTLLLPLVVTFTMTVVTVGLMAIRSAQADPARVLRSE